MTLLRGDCLELMKQVPDKSIDLILCDLPYGTTALKWDKVLDKNKAERHIRGGEATRQKYMHMINRIKN